MSRCVAMQSGSGRVLRPCHAISNVAARLYVTLLGLEQWDTLAVDFKVSKVK